MKRNDGLIDDVVDYIRKHPDEWNQAVWGYRESCGTQACFAGTALLLSGYEISENGGFVNPDGDKVWSVPNEAQMLLGITEPQRWLLFFALSEEQGQAALEYVVAEIKAGRAETKDDIRVIGDELERLEDAAYEAAS